MASGSGWEDLIDPKELVQAMEVDPDVAKATKELAERVAEEWRANSPADTGEYRDHIKVETVPGIASARVTNTYYTAAWIEYGTGDPGPTPEYAPMAKTAAKFKGTPDLMVTDDVL